MVSILPQLEPITLERVKAIQSLPSGQTRRKCFGTNSGIQAAKKNGSISFSVNFQESIKPAYEAMTGFELRFSEKFKNYWHPVKKEEVEKIQEWERSQGCRVFIRDIGRDYEWELMPLGLDQGLSLMVWSPLGWARLTGKIRRGQKSKEGRIAEGGDNYGPLPDNEYLFTVIDALDEVAKETGKTISQIAINWLLQQPSVCNVVIGARNEEQLKQNLGSIGWNLSPEYTNRLDDASRRLPTYPYWHQRGYNDRNPKPTKW